MEVILNLKNNTWTEKWYETYADFETMGMNGATPKDLALAETEVQRVSVIQFSDKPFLKLQLMAAYRDYKSSCVRIEKDTSKYRYQARLIK